MKELYLATIEYRKCVLAGSPEEANELLRATFPHEQETSISIPDVKKVTSTKSVPDDLLDDVPVHSDGRTARELLNN